MDESLRGILSFFDVGRLGASIYFFHYPNITPTYRPPTAYITVKMRL